MGDDLYISDALVWSEQQADLLTRLARGERVGDSVDWTHIIEEMRDVGLSQLSACESLIRKALIHLPKPRCALALGDLLADDIDVDDLASRIGAP